MPDTTGDTDKNLSVTMHTSNSVPESIEEFLEVPLNSVPYREYMETAPQYIPGQGISRYMSSLKNLIPVRKNKKVKGSINVDKAGLFSFIFYTWLSPFIYKAYRKGLTADDVPSGSPLESCDLNSQRLELLWQKEVAEKGISGASFGYVVWRFVRTRIIASCFLYCLALSMGFLSPAIFMRQLLQFAQNENASTSEGVMWALCLTCAEFMRLVFVAWYWGVSNRTAIRLRSACVAMLYRKILRLNGLGERSTGELINIFALDTQRMFDMVLFGPMIIGGPLVTVCGVCYIYWLLGGWALFGMATFLLFYPTQYGISRLSSYLRSKTIIATDKRVKVMTEVLNSIKFIKMYAWENYFSKCIKEIRANEHTLLQKSSYCQSMSMSLACTVPAISAVITFLAHISTGSNLSAAQAFPLIAILNTQLRISFDNLRIGTSNIYESLVAFPRFKRILCMEDIAPYIIHPIDKSEAIHIVGGTFAYNTPPTVTSPTSVGKSALPKEPEAECLNAILGDRKYITVLQDICFQAPKGKLIGVCGPVGSGKTSLILACLGQMRKLSGQVTRDGTCAYVSQEAWILNASLRENILFGERFDSKRYYEAIYACSLTEDINMLPGGDQTEIGEKGINLSGGQKQRVALARALYSNRDMYFLDDPLSAVDAHVGAEIFQRYIMTSLRGKTIVFVTHQMQYLSNCDDIYMLKDGQVIEHGSHNDLMKNDGEYAHMLKTCLLEKEQKTQIPFQNEESSGDVGRKASLTTDKSLQENKNSSVKGDQMIVPEHIEQGQIKFYTYHSYVAAAGGYIVAALVFITFLMNVGSTTFSSWWLATWIKEGGGSTLIIHNNQTHKSDQLIDNPDFPVYRLVYGISVVVIMGTSLLRGFVFTKATLHASTRIHNKLFNKIIHCPMLFFETTPIGRIQNLFARDMDEVDVRLPFTVESIMQNLLIVFFAILLICLVFPWFIIPMAFLGGVYYFMSKIFRVVVRDLKRLENVTRSPIFSWIGTTVQGLNTIHAFEKENEFIRRFTYMYDENSTCLYLCNVAGRWLAIRMDKLAVLIICITAFLVIILRGQVPPAMAGLALAYAAQISGLFQYTIRLISDTEIRFISVERMNAYLQNVVQEGHGSLKRPSAEWPSRGNIRFENVGLTYRKGLPDVIKNISFYINSGEKVGIVGRTGSGKSSLIVALFRLVEISSGQIKIDGINIADVSLEVLRSRLTVIPQDPVLFAGTIRSNLDPHQLFSDSDLWNALEKTTLKNKISSTADQLDASVNASGNNFSTGERQLLCLARALLKNTKILILDEATAAVDPETEVAIQTAIQKEFHHCTVLTIAHRLSTVTSSDRVLVMDNGKVVEFDSPSNLLSNNNSHFYQLCSSAENAVNQALLNVPVS
ncbi:hypothetical protein R5R35_006438 [Gryllus longicercus]|uniref:Multidrug resistance-associated protein 5 n=1 Tax=Gryllus longicercus TaxID=2509291 RepID=A0AAN9ZFI8_9ORTH